MKETKVDYSRKRIEAEHHIKNMRKAVKSNKTKILDLKKQIEKVRNDNSVLESSIVIKVQELAHINSILDLSKTSKDEEKEKLLMKNNEALLKFREKYNY